MLLERKVCIHSVVSYLGTWHGNSIGFQICVTSPNVMMALKLYNNNYGVSFLAACS